MLNIQKTDKYSQFKLFSGNRVVSSEKLLQSVKRKNLLESHPILVDKEFRVIDGQHRLQVAKDLKVPIYYVVCDGLEEDDIPICQVQKPWKIEDFLDFFENKKSDYRFVKQCSQDFKLPIHFIIEMSYHDSRSAFTVFRRGDFHIKKNKDLLRSKFILFCDIKSFCEGIQKYKFHKSSSSAIWRLINRPDYVHEHFMEKLDMYRDQFMNAFKFQSPRNVYEALVSDVYNRNVKDKKKTLLIEPTKIRLRRIKQKNQIFLDFEEIL